MMELRRSATSARAGRSANWCTAHAALTMRASLCGYLETRRGSEDCRRGLDVAVAHAPRAKAAGARTCHSRTCFHLHRSCPRQSITSQHASYNTQAPGRASLEQLRDCSTRLSDSGHQHCRSRLPHAYSPAAVPHTSYPAVAPSISQHGTQRPLPRAQPLESLRSPLRADTSTATTATTAPAATEHATPQLWWGQPGAQHQPLRAEPACLSVKQCWHRRWSRWRRARSCSWPRRGRWRDRSGRTRGAHAFRPWRSAAAGRRTWPGRRKGSCWPADPRRMEVEPAPRDGPPALPHRPVPIHQHGQYAFSYELVASFVVCGACLTYVLQGHH
jgi:hypothetical protein